VLTIVPGTAGTTATRVFLLSPAYCAGRRAAILLRPDSDLKIARDLRNGQLTLGEAFSFLSGLYFRGKLAYATAFGRAEGHSATLIITPTRGLQPPATPVTPELLREFASVDVCASDPRYRAPLERDANALASRVGEAGRVVLLGSLATDKYVEVLMAVFRHRLEYPPSFVGRGDMSRGGLLLRSVTARTELGYSPLDATAQRHGPRPPKLPPLSKLEPPRTT
jgi:hypothetical protein